MRAQVGPAHSFSGPAPTYGLEERGALGSELYGGVVMSGRNRGCDKVTFSSRFSCYTLFVFPLNQSSSVHLLSALLGEWEVRLYQRKVTHIGAQTSGIRESGRWRCLGAEDGWGRGGTGSRPCEGKDGLMLLLEG